MLGYAFRNGCPAFHFLGKRIPIFKITAAFGSVKSNGKGKILCSDPIDKGCAEILEKAGFHVDMKSKLTNEQLKAIIPEYRGLIVRSETKVTADIMAAGKNLEIIGRAGTGVDNIDMVAANHLGKVIMNTPGGNTTSAAELTMSMIFATARNISQACSSLKDGKWDRKTFVGSELNLKTIGIIGLGRIGREVAKWCQGFGMKTVGYDPIMSTESAREAGIEKMSLDKLLSVSDFITIHTPLTAETKGLINKDTLKKCKDGVRIVNCARGGIVKEKDLLEAIESGKVAGAALDTFSVEPPTKEILEIIKHPAIICTPHLGASTSEAQAKVAIDIAQQFVNAFDKNEYFGVVNAGYIGLAKQPHIIPFLDLAERLGSILGQTLEGEVKRLTMNLYGKELSKDKVAQIVSNSTLNGLLAHLITDPVNLVNAPYLAKEHGLEIKVNRFSENDRKENTIELILENDSSKKQTLVGTVYQGDTIRVVQIDDFKVEINPVGNLIIFWNYDKPGVIAAVTTTLASENVNIADMSLGRTKLDAVGIIHADEQVDFSIIEKLQKLTNMKKVRRIILAQPSIIKTNGNGRPRIKPENPNFGSGPCAKRPGYELASLPTNLLGRSHRSVSGKDRLIKATEDCKRILGIPEDYVVGIVPASDTGAVEMALWGLLSKEKPVDAVFWESFGKDWHRDISKELKLTVNKFEADYGLLPDLSKVNTKEHDVVFTWNGTTSGVKIPNGEWISNDRKGLTICDATSAAFAMELPWNKLDVTTFSWQKVLGGEAGHGIIVASPRAIERWEKLKNDRPWPMPKIFRFSADIFTGNVINTPSMLCVEDFIDALQWAESIGGFEELKRRSNENLAIIEKFCAENKWISFLAADKNIRSNTSICLKLALNEKQLKEFVKTLEVEKVAYDINSYKAAPLGIRIWGGATVANSDMQALMLWLKWAYEKIIAK